MDSSDDIFDLFKDDLDFPLRDHVNEDDLCVIHKCHSSLKKCGSHEEYATKIFAKLLNNYKDKKGCLKSILIYLGYVFYRKEKAITGVDHPPAENNWMGVMKCQSPISLIRECCSNPETLLQSLPDDVEKVSFKILSNFLNYPTPFNTDFRNLKYKNLEDDCRVGEYLNYCVMRVENFGLIQQKYYVVLPFVDDYLFNVWIPANGIGKVFFCDHSHDIEEYIERLERLLFSYYHTEQKEILGMMFYLMCCKPLFRKGNEEVVSAMFRYLCPDLDFDEMEKKCYSLFVEEFVKNF